MADMRWEHQDGSTTLHPAENGCWEHPCGSQFFYLNDDGSVECASCRQVLTGFRWNRSGIS